MKRFVLVAALVLSLVGLATTAKAGHCGGVALVAPQALVFPGFQPVQPFGFQSQQLLFQPQQFLAAPQFVVQQPPVVVQRQIVRQQVVQQQPFVQRSVIRSQPLLFPRLRGF